MIVAAAPVKAVAIYGVGRSGRKRDDEPVLSCATLQNADLSFESVLASAIR